MNFRKKIKLLFCFLIFIENKSDNNENDNKNNLNLNNKIILGLLTTGAIYFIYKKFLNKKSNNYKNDEKLEDINNNLNESKNKLDSNLENKIKNNSPKDIKKNQINSLENNNNGEQESKINKKELNEKRQEIDNGIKEINRYGNINNINIIDNEKDLYKNEDLSKPFIFIPKEKPNRRNKKKSSENIEEIDKELEKINKELEKIDKLQKIQKLNLKLNEIIYFNEEEQVILQSFYNNNEIVEIDENVLTESIINNLRENNKNNERIINEKNRSNIKIRKNILNTGDIILPNGLIRWNEKEDENNKKTGNCGAVAMQLALSEVVKKIILENLKINPNFLNNENLNKINNSFSNLILNSSKDLLNVINNEENDKRYVEFDLKRIKTEIKNLKQNDDENLISVCYLDKNNVQKIINPENKENKEIDIIITNVDGNHYDLWINGDKDLEIKERFIYTPGTKNADFSKGAELINKYQFGLGFKINKENINKFDLNKKDYLSQIGYQKILNVLNSVKKYLIKIDSGEVLSKSFLEELVDEDNDAEIKFYPV